MRWPWKAFSAAAAAVPVTASTRATLERLPANLAEYRPHEKSMPLGKLAVHIAMLPAFGVSALTTEGLNLATAQLPRISFESGPQVVGVFNEGVKQLQAVLAKIKDADVDHPWKLSIGDKTVAEGPCTLLYYSMFLNHLVHHRAQLGVYLRLNNIPVPSVYGPSADERLGF
jgi:uncharacterized damage-inducible protein DinB